MEAVPGILLEAFDDILGQFFSSKEVQIALAQAGEEPEVAEPDVKPELTREELDRREKVWAAVRADVDAAAEAKDWKKAVALLEKACREDLGGLEVRNRLSAIFRSAEWRKIRDKVTVQRFEVSAGVSPGADTFLYNTLIAELTASQKCTVVDWEQIDRVLKVISKSQPNVSGEDAKTMAMNQLGVARLFVGSVAKLGGKFHVTVKALKLDLSVATVHQDSTGSESDLAASVKTIAQRIIYPSKP